MHTKGENNAKKIKKRMVNIVPPYVIHCCQRQLEHVQKALRQRKVAQQVRAIFYRTNYGGSTMQQKKKFNWLAFFTAPYYYAGYGKFLHGVVLSLVGVIPMTALLAALYGGLRANQEVETEGKKFNWVHAVAVGVIQIVFGVIFLSLFSNSTISAVKDGYLTTLSSTKTIGDALDDYDYFSDVEWSEVKADETNAIVEAKMKLNVPSITDKPGVAAFLVIQFLLNKQSGTFQISASRLQLYMNDTLVHSDDADSDLPGMLTMIYLNQPFDI